MLVNVHVKNLALIDEEEVYFKEGLNILTGETGAGKSIIIGSINIALGGKLPKDIVRDNADYGLVELVFETDRENVLRKLVELDIPNEDGQIIITRKIVNGRSTIKVNGETVSVSKLRELTTLLIDVYGQHDHESLINKNKHMSILDEFAEKELEQLLSEVKNAYEVYKSLQKKLEEFDINEEEKNKELSFLEFQLNEIEEADIKKDEDTLLEEEYKKMSHSKKIVEALNGVYQIVGSQSDNCFANEIGYGIKELSQCMEYDNRLEEFYNSLMDIDSLCSDLAREVSGYIDEMTFDEERVQYVSERLNTINRLKMKYGADIHTIQAKYEDLKKRYELLKNADEQLELIKEKLEKNEKKLKAASDRLSKKRKQQAVALENSIKEAMLDLNFNDVKFKVNFGESTAYTSKGTDIIEFYISLNPGEKLRPLSQIASGGELSRIMLALKSVMAGNDDIETLIFDEIDTGISGRTAQKVSEKMRLISRERQVLAITHLPQIAAMADTHFLIEKTAENGISKTGIRELRGDETVLELARMLGGREITETVIENAREMKKIAKN